VGIAMATAQLAHQKGYSSRWWFLWGMLLPMISLIALAIKPKRVKPFSKFHAPVDQNHHDKVLFTRKDS
jgi:hypothetical protein